MNRISAALIVAAAASTAMADGSALGLFFPFDSNNTAGWATSMAPNDDLSSGNIPLGFDFCFYEQTKTSVYINNNGNLSFSGPFGSFTSTGFPVNGFDMIAPFWADVDTRNQAGANTNQVWHKFVDMDNDLANDTLVVTWDAVGYYSGNVDRLNTFQVAISGIRNAFGGPNGIGGLNAMFSYGNMDWTTGQASGGGPFGGTAATVGINNGNGIDFDQIGRFDHAGFDYNGNGLQGELSGVDYLDGRDYFFDACNGIVPAPGALGLLGLGGLVAGRRRR